MSKGGASVADALGGRGATGDVTLVGACPKGGSLACCEGDKKLPLSRRLKSRLTYGWNECLATAETSSCNL